MHACAAGSTGVLQRHVQALLLGASGSLRRCYLLPNLAAALLTAAHLATTAYFVAAAYLVAGAYLATAALMVATFAPLLRQSTAGLMSSWLTRCLYWMANSSSESTCGEHCREHLGVC